MPSSTRRSRRPPNRRVRLLFLNSRSRSSASGGAAAARSPTTAAGSRPRRGSPSTMAGRASKNCRRSRPRWRSIPRARSSPATNSPDIGFDRSINPYRGCEHGCVYCFARPTHAYLGLSPGLDFESKLFAKPDAAELLEKELAAPGYEPRMIAIGTNTDPYQPIEREHKIMRGILEVLERAGHPVGIVTKSALVTRDIDILPRMAKRNLAKVAHFGDDARPQARAHHGAARLDAAEAAGGAAAIVGGRHSRDRDGGARHPGAERSRDRAHSRCGRPCRRQGGGLRAAAAAAGSARSVPRMADGELSRPLSPRLHPDPRHARRRTTTRNGARG